MADTGLWGTAVGSHVAAQELLDAALGYSTVGVQGAHERYYNAEALEKETKAKENQQLFDLMQRQAAGQPIGPPGPGRPPVSMSERLNDLAQTAMNAGLVTKAQELAKNAALVGQREESAGASAAGAAVNRLKAIRERAELNGQLFGGATDEATWQQAGQLWQFQTGLPNPYKGVPYSKELADRINSAALSTKERLDAQEKELARGALNAFRDRRLGQHDTENAIRESRLALAQAREDRLAKAGGGKTVSSPATSEITQAKRLIQRDYENLKAPDLDDGAYAIAAEARALRKSNPALDANVALQQAYNNAKQAGDFVTLREGFFGYGGKQGFRGAGKTPQAPAAMPKDSSQLQKDRYYVSPTGLVGKWNGKGFEVVPGGRASGIGRPLSPGNGNPDAEADDEEE